MLWMFILTKKQKHPEKRNKQQFTENRHNTNI